MLIMHPYRYKVFLFLKGDTMKVFIASGSNENIKEEYLKETKSVCQILCDLDYSLVFGACLNGMMGVCYNTFKENKKDILGVTIDAYHDDLKYFSSIKILETDTSFKRLEYIYNESDIFLFLPGGTGSLSELFSIMEELKTNKIQKKIVLYNYNGFYNELLDYINILNKYGFIYENEIGKIIIIENKKELEEVFKNERN